MKRGDIVQLGPHRLMCGDSTDSSDVSNLFDGARADIVITSPPYLQQRKYNAHVEINWDEMMKKSFSSDVYHKNTQILVNLGLVHRRHEWTAYWADWAEWMSLAGWKKIGWYVWDKMDGMPTVPMHGRLYNCHEFVFHFAQTPLRPNKITSCKSAGTPVRTVSMRARNGMKTRAMPPGTVTHSHRIPDSVFRLTTRGRRIPGQNGHFPIGLPLHYMLCFSQDKAIAHDPFCGSGTSILAAQISNRVCLGMEQSPDYCELAIQRYRKHIESAQANLKPKRKVVMV